MNIDFTVTEDIKPGDIVLCKDYSEAPWQIGIFHHIDKKADPKHKYHVILQIGYDEDKLNTPIKDLFQIFPYRYISKLIIDK